MSDYLRFLLGLHAQARQIDRDQALLGALGVGAFAYPHQIDSVHRIITGTACRWLISDEVGLGKTIQAIMVMRALAAQSARGLRVALVIPDDLVTQWEEELLARGHVLAFDQRGDVANDSKLVVKLARPSALAKDLRIDPERTDLLVVDEFPRLTAQIRRDLVNVSRTIPNVILLTATPTLHVVGTRRELLSILEPEASQIAQAEGRDILDVLAEREREASAQYGTELQDSHRRREVEDTYGVYRRLIRTQRSDYPNALPQRSYHPIRVEPTDGDVRRAQATRNYLAAARVVGLDLRSDRLLQVAGRSPAALRDRTSTLKRSPAILIQPWGELDQCLREDWGDARLDALVDHVRSVHRERPDKRIVVVAEDNPTTDYLREMLEKLADVKVAAKRRVVSTADDLGVHIAALRDTMDEFVNGEATVLVAADIAREGHNLQFAEEIIFFALPWSPPAIQQWIGRIDRLGTKGLPSSRQIDITPIVVRGSIEDRILEVLEETKVFVRSEIYDDDNWAGINLAIDSAAYGLAGGSWSEAAKRAKEVGTTYEEWRTETILPPSQRADLAIALESKLRRRPYVLPFTAADTVSPRTWFFARELAAEAMLRLAGSLYLDLRSGRDESQRFRTMWYRGDNRNRELTFRELDTRSSFYRQAYIAKRSAISCPPRTNVVQNDGEKRVLHFFDHGDALHDDIIATLEKAAPKLEWGWEQIVEFPQGHPALAWEGQRLFLAASEIHLFERLGVDIERLMTLADGIRSRAEQEARDSAIRRALTELEADQRWLLDLCPPDVLLSCLVDDGTHVQPVDAAAAVLDPFHADQAARQVARRKTELTNERLQDARRMAINLLRDAGRERVQQATAAVRRATKDRLFEAEADARYGVAAARCDIAVKARLDDRYEFNRAEQRAADLTARLSEAVWSLRLQRLTELEKKIGAVPLSPPKWLLLVPRRMAPQT